MRSNDTLRDEANGKKKKKKFFLNGGMLQMAGVRNNPSKNYSWGETVGKDQRQSLQTS